MSSTTTESTTTRIPVMTTSTTSSSGNILSNEETSTIEERILTLQRAIHKLTRDSWQHHHAVITPSENPDIDRNDPTASFHLGMELFGQEVSLVEEAVREKLTNLERELLVVRDELLSSTTGTTMGEERDKKTDLNTGMSAEGRGPTRRSRAELSSEIEQLEIKIRFLRECSTIRTILDDVATALRSHDPQRAVQGVLDAEHAVTRARGVIQHQSIMASRETLAAAQRIVESVAMDVRREKVHLVHMALKGWNDNVILTSDTLSVRREEDLALCFDLLGSLQPSIVLHDTIRKFVLDLYQTVLEPVLTRHSKGRDTVVYPLSIQKVQDKETGMPKPLGYSSSSSNAWRLEWSRTADETEKTTNDQSGLSLIMAWKDTFAFLRQIILFSAEHILLNRAPLCKLMGEILFGKPKAVPHVSATFEALGMDRASRLFDGDDGILYEKLLETLEETCIPISLERDEWKQLGELSRDLDEFMAPFWNDLESKRIWSDTNSKLAAFTTLLEEQYIERRRCMLLNQARSLIVKSDYHNTVEVGEEVRQGSEEERLGLKDGMTVFLLHKSSISESAFNLLELVRVTMNEAVEQHVTQTLTTQERLSPALYRTARDMLDMFRAIIPIKYGHEISQMPRTAAILHNDCVYLAHHCLTLGLEYRDKFGKETLLGQMCIFVDMVPLFRDLAERSMGIH